MKLYQALLILSAIILCSIWFVFPEVPLDAPCIEPGDTSSAKIHFYRMEEPKSNWREEVTFTIASLNGVVLLISGIKSLRKGKKRKK